MNKILTIILQCFKFIDNANAKIPSAKARAPKTCLSTSTCASYAPAYEEVCSSENASNALQAAKILKKR